MQPCHRMTSTQKICSVYRKQKEQAVMYKQLQVLLFDGVMHFTLFPKVCVPQGLFIKTCKGCGCDSRDCMQVKREWSHIDCGRTLGKLLARSDPAWKVISKLDFKNMLEQEVQEKVLQKTKCAWTLCSMCLLHKAQVSQLAHTSGKCFLGVKFTLWCCTCWLLCMVIELYCQDHYERVHQLSSISLLSLNGICFHKLN